MENDTDFLGADKCLIDKELYAVFRGMVVRTNPLRYPEITTSRLVLGRCTPNFINAATWWRCLRAEASAR